MEGLPDQCNYLALGAARISEIKAIVSKLDNCEHGNRVFQNQPRHMQRRAVSSNPKRLPVYLREKHMREGGANVKPSHRPRRKYRRRPKNLLAEYNRRQKEFVWLETHVWHAKRFHMRRKWGYNLPDSPTFKGYRASLRAAKKSCLLQDISFMCCIELEGSKSVLLSGLSTMIQPFSAPALSDPLLQQGRKSTTVTLFQPNSHTPIYNQPYNAIGDVEVFWHPPSNQAGEGVKLWLWVHPSTHTQVVDTLVDVFSLVRVAKVKCSPPSDRERLVDDRQDAEELMEADNKDNKLEGIIDLAEEIMECHVQEDYDKNMTGKEKESNLPRNLNNENKESNVMNQDKKTDQKQPKRPNNVNKEKIATKNIPYSRTPKYISTSKSVTMTLLKDTLNRLRLTGPLTYSVISSALHPASVSKQEGDIKDLDEDTEDSTQPWWWEYYSSEKARAEHQKQVKAWKGLVSCAKSQVGAILPLTVRDPRATLPHKKLPMNTLMSESGNGDPIDCPVASPLYDSSVRDVVTLSKEPDSVINNRRSQLLVPGSQLPESDEESRLPLLLVARPPTLEDYGSGCDIIVPGGWSMSVWMSILFCGGATGGQREAETLHLEIHTPLPPHLLPDTLAGEYYARSLALKRRAHFFLRPPTARHNFTKLGVQYPFSQPWRKLAMDWEPATEHIYALRDPRLLRDLAKLVADPQSNTGMEVTKKRKSESSEANASKKLKADKDTKLSGKETIHAHYIEQELQEMSSGCLVAIKLELCYKGTLEECAMICMPKEEDLQAREKIKLPSLKIEDITEPPHTDDQAQHRTKLKDEHKKIKRRMQQQRGKARKRVTLKSPIMSGGKIQSVEQAKKEALLEVEKNNQKILEKYSTYREAMEAAWLMNPNDPLQCCSRKICGYVTHGTFSQTLGRGAGIGWVALQPLLALVQMCREVESSEEESEVTQSNSNTQQTSSTCKQKSGAIDWQKDSKSKEPLDSPFGGDNIKGKSNMCLVLVRNPSSLQYRWAKLSILTQFNGDQE